MGVKINSLNDHIDKAAGACGFGSYIYARLKETNYILGTITEYPVVVRQFFEMITPTDLDGVYKRASKFLFCGDLGEAEPDTATQVMPIVEEMIDRSAEFSRHCGIGESRCRSRRSPRSPPDSISWSAESNARRR